MTLSDKYESPEASCNKRADTYFGTRSASIMKESHIRMSELLISSFTSSEPRQHSIVFNNVITGILDGFFNDTTIINQQEPLEDVRADKLSLSLIYDAFTGCFIHNSDQNSKIQFIGHWIYGRSIYKGFMEWCCKRQAYVFQGKFDFRFLHKNGCQIALNILPVSK